MLQIIVSGLFRILMLALLALPGAIEAAEPDVVRHNDLIYAEGDVCHGR